MSYQEFLAWQPTNEWERDKVKEFDYLIDRLADIIANRVIRKMKDYDMANGKLGK